MRGDNHQSHGFYRSAGLKADDLLACPFAQLGVWLQEAADYPLHEPAVMVLATTGTDGRPDQRSVLLRDNQPGGLAFFSDYQSKKSRDMAANPWVSALFPWHAMDRQVRVLGRAEKMGAAETTRLLVEPPNSDLPEIDPHKYLLKQFAVMKSRFYEGGRQPSQWGGYRLVADQFEFWQGGGPRLRDRYLYTLDEDGLWSLQPSWQGADAARCRP